MRGCDVAHSLEQARSVHTKLIHLFNSSLKLHLSSGLLVSPNKSPVVSLARSVQGFAVLSDVLCEFCADKHLKPIDAGRLINEADPTSEITLFPGPTRKYPVRDSLTHSSSLILPESDRDRFGLKIRC